MQLTAGTIAQYIGGTVDGCADVTVHNFAKIEEATPGTITFLANPKYTHYIYSTKASVVLVSNDFVAEQPVAATLIRVADPYSALSVLMGVAAKALQPDHEGVEQGSYIADGVEIPQGCYVGAFAYIAKGARIGKNVKIYPQVYVGEGVVIGDDTVLYPGVKVYYGCKIGQRCVIHAGAVIGSDGFGFAPDDKGVYHKIAQLGIVEIDDDVEIGANTTIDRSTMGRTYIARGAKLDNLIQVAHNVEIGHDTVVASQSGIAGSSKVGAHCMLGGQVGVAGHISIGDGVAVGAQTGIPKSIAAGSRIMGTPAMPAGEYARMVAAQKKLVELMARVDSLEKQLAEKQHAEK